MCKVVDKLNEFFKKDCKDYEFKWGDLGVFVKYGMILEEKFNDKVEKFVFFINIEGEFFMIVEYKEKIKDVQMDKYDKIIYLYINNLVDYDSVI